MPSTTYWAGPQVSLWDETPGKLLTSHVVLHTSLFPGHQAVWSLTQWKLPELPLLLASGHTCPICPSVLAVSLCPWQGFPLEVGARLN